MAVDIPVQVMKEEVEVFWQEVLVPYGIANGVFLRLHLDPTQLLFDYIGHPSVPVLAFLTVVNVIPLILAVVWSFEFGRGLGVLSFAVAGLAGYVLPAAPVAGILVAVVAAGLAAMGPAWKDVRG